MNNDFNFKFIDENLQNEFLQYINDNVKEFFSSTHRTPTYNIPRLLALSMVNEGGKYQTRFNELANRIALADTVKQRANMADSFLTIHMFFGTSIQRVYNELETMINVWDNYEGNLVDWEIVWYTRYRPIAEGTIQV